MEEKRKEMTKLINILMQRNDCNVPWGFDIQEREHLQQPLIINRVSLIVFIF